MAQVYTVRLACLSMATRFELVLRSEDRMLARAIGEEAIAEIELIASRFSFYDPRSELVAINQSAGAHPVEVAPDLYGLIARALDISRLTNGAFDPTVGPLMRCWGFVGDNGSLPDSDAVEQAMSTTGYTRVKLNPEDSTVRFDSTGIELDLGGIAKGYALDEAARIIRNGGIKSALLHGGTSTAVGLGLDPDGQPWRIGIEDASELLIGSVSCSNHAFSVSAQSGKSFLVNNKEYGHVLDPLTGQPTNEALLAAVAAGTATAADALSTAALVLGSKSHQIREACLGWATLGTGVADGSTEGRRVFECHGLPKFRRGHNAKEQSHNAKEQSHNAKEELPDYRIFDV